MFSRLSFSLITKRYSSAAICRQSSSSTVTALSYEKHGNPTDVLHSKVTELPKLGPEQVHIKMVASPINPADINAIQGVYPVKRQLPSIGGNEGVGEIIEVGSKVKIFKPGDKVLPGGSHDVTGTWCSDIICSLPGLLPIPSDISIIDAATLSVNPATAYRMLNDFVSLKEGDYIIQNGANSGVGQAVVQLAKQMKINTINIVRDRENIAELTKKLTALGATHVVTDTFLKSKEMKDFMHDIPAPVLAFNCVGGRITTEILKHLDEGATMVTYGGMSMQPMMIPAGSLIFKDIIFKGYWMNRWSNENRNSQKRINMLKYLLEMIRNENLKTSNYRLVDLSNYQDAIAKSMESFHTEKQILYLAGDCKLKSKIPSKIY